MKQGPARWPPGGRKSSGTSRCRGFGQGVLGVRGAGTQAGGAGRSSLSCSRAHSGHMPTSCLPVSLGSTTTFPKKGPGPKQGTVTLAPQKYSSGSGPPSGSAQLLPEVGVCGPTQRPVTGYRWRASASSLAVGRLQERGDLLRWSEPIWQGEPSGQPGCFGAGWGVRGFLRPPREMEGGLAAVAPNMRTSSKLSMQLHFQQMTTGLTGSVIGSPAHV